MGAKTHTVYLDCTPTIEARANVDLAENDIVFLEATESGRVVARKALATTNAAGAAHVLFIVRRAALVGQIAEVSLCRAVYLASPPGAIGATLYLQDDGSLGGTVGTVTRACAVRSPGGYVFSGAI